MAMMAMAMGTGMEMGMEMEMEMGMGMGMGMGDGNGDGDTYKLWLLVTHGLLNTVNYTRWYFMKVLVLTMKRVTL